MGGYTLPKLSHGTFDGRGGMEARVVFACCMMLVAHNKEGVAAVSLPQRRTVVSRADAKRNACNRM